MTNIQLSPHFSLDELCKSQQAERSGINNTVEDTGILKNLEMLCLHVLEPIRLHYGIPFTPSSGYRSVDLNHAIGGAVTSQHSKGEAADIEIPGVTNFDLATWISQNIQFDQLILEFYKPGQPGSGWVHVSFSQKLLRHSILTTSDGRVYQQGLIK
jgi:hypothetical protein